MTRYTVKDMSCEHCVSTITNAIKNRDPDATVDIDLAGKMVTLDSVVADSELCGAIQAAGYEPEPAV